MRVNSLSQWVSLTIFHDKASLWEAAKFLVWTSNSWPSRRGSEATSWVTQTYFLSQLWTETKECEASFPPIQPWQGCWRCQRCPALGGAAVSLPRLQRAEPLVSLLVSVFAFAFYNLKIIRMKLILINCFDPFYFSSPFFFLTAVLFSMGVMTTWWSRKLHIALDFQAFCILWNGYE